MSAGMAELTIRPYRENDLEYLDELIIKIYRDEYGFYPEYTDDIIRDMHEFVETPDKSYEKLWVAEIEGEITGMIALRKTFEPGTGRIAFLAVPKGMRRRGIGRHLTDVALGSAKNWNYDRIVLNMPSTLRAAISFFIKRRFSLVKTTEVKGLRDGPVLDEFWEKYI